MHCTFSWMYSRALDRSWMWPFTLQSLQGTPCLLHEGLPGLE